MVSTCNVSMEWYIKSQKMAMAEPGNTKSREQVLTEHAVEALAATKFALAFVLCHCRYLPGRPRSMADKCQSVFKATLGFAGINSATTLHIDPRDLPQCNSVSSSRGFCVHCKAVVDELEAERGSAWRDNSPMHFLLASLRFPQCKSLLSWH